MRAVIAIVSLPLLAGCSVSDEAQPGKKDPEPPVVRAAECRWRNGDIKIDGILDDKAWQDAQVLENFAVFWQNRKAKTATKARLLWDSEHLYFSAEMEDADLYADVKEHNGMTWNNDVFELFFKPSKDKLA